MRRLSFLLLPLFNQSIIMRVSTNFVLLAILAYKSSNVLALPVVSLFLPFCEG